MNDPLDEVLRLVAEGHLTADEAAPVIDALQAYGGLGGDTDDAAPADEPAASSTGRARVLRIEVSEDGRKVVNLRVPLSLGQMGLDRIPGLSSDSVSRIRQAFAEGLTGPILAVDEDGGNGVRIVLE